MGSRFLLSAPSFFPSLSACEADDGRYCMARDELDIGIVFVFDVVGVSLIGSQHKVRQATCTR